MAPRILLIDDEPDMLFLLRSILESTDVETDATSSPSEGVSWLRAKDYDVVITDLKMPEMDGMEVLDAVKRVDEKIPVLMLTAFGTIESAVAAMRRGAFDYMTKPFQKDIILMIVRRALEWRGVHCQLRQLRDELDERYRHIVGQSPAIREVERLISQVAAVDVPVLIRGPEGSGKEAVARAIHHLSDRSRGPYVPFFCAGASAAIPEKEIVERLFGGGSAGGVVAAAKGGSLFIDDVASLPNEAQSRLAELAGRGHGGVGDERAAFRLLGGALDPLRLVMAQGRLQRELRRLLGALRIELPALDERKEDIPLLAQHFVQKYARLYGKDVKELSELALRWLSAREWPGNVAELENVIQRGVIMATSGLLQESDLIPADYIANGLPYAVPDVFSLPLPEAEEKVLACFHREYLRKTLAKAKGDVTAAAVQAGLTKAEFSRLKKEYQIE
ncbi:MAG: sigma-54 dependent transcriptional regulator [Pseudomonadota bacterium]